MHEITNKFYGFAKSSKNFSLNISGKELNALFEKLSGNEEPFNHRLIRFIAEYSDAVALPETDKDGKLTPDEKYIAGLKKFICNALKKTGVRVTESVDKNVRNWLSAKDYTMTKNSQRKGFFQLSFALNLSVEQVTVMFNKLFAQPAFIREPESLIYMYCLEKNLLFKDAEALYAEYLSKTEQAGETDSDIESVKYTNRLFKDYLSLNNQDFTDQLVRDSAQFEYANIQAVEEISKIADMYKKRDFYSEKLDYILEDDDDQDALWTDGWDGIDDYDESIDGQYNSSVRVSTTQAIITNFPLFLSLLSDESPNENGEFSAIFEEALDLGYVSPDDFINNFESQLGTIRYKDIKLSFLRKAFYDFPSVKMIFNTDKLNDKSVSRYVKYEKLRKLLIMLRFLKFNTEKIQNCLCTDYINMKLGKCGFAKLYPLNPFDFVFILAGNSKEPIKTLIAIWDYAMVKSKESGTHSR